MKRIAIIGLVVVLLLSLLMIVPASAAEYGTVVGGYLRLRSGPSYDATIIKKYYTGTVVEITGTSGDWYEVITPDDREGYMHSDYITLGGVPGSVTKYVTSTNGYGVRLRVGPSKGYRILGVYPVDTEVAVIQTGVIWSSIRIGSVAGFMMSEFLTSTEPGSSPSTPEGDDMATVWSANGYGVRLRSGPSTSYPIIGLYSVDTRVSVVERGTYWDEIIVGSRHGHMMNEFLIYDDPDQTEATGITVTADSSTGMQGETIDLDVTVTGTNLSAHAYDLEITENDDMADIVDGTLVISESATVDAEIVITATTTDDGPDDEPLTDSCTVTVTAAQPRVAAFAFDDTEITVSISGGDVVKRIGYTISGFDLPEPGFTLEVSSEAGSHVTCSIDEDNDEIVLQISSAIADETEFTVTGTTTVENADGDLLTAELAVTITSDELTLTSIELLPEKTELRHDDSAEINARLHYSDGSYATATIALEYTLAVTSGGTYASVGGNLLVPTASALEGVADQTIEITGTSADDPSITDTCEILLYGRNEPDPPTLVSAVPAHESVTLTWTAPDNDGGDDITEYFGYYSLTGSEPYTLLLTGSDTIGPDETDYTFEGLTNDEDYYFYIVAYNAQGESDVSNGIPATPNPTAPGAPAIVAVTRTDGSVKLEWDPPANTGGTGVVIEKYKVFIDGGDGTDVLAEEYTWSGLTNGESHEFTVVAYNSATSGAPAAETTSAVGQPDAPIIGSRNAGLNEISITWSSGDTGGEDIVDYHVYIKKASEDDAFAVMDTVTGTNYTFVVTDYTDYQYWVVANNGIYLSDPSIRETLSPTYTTPGAPTIDSSSADYRSITLSWTPSATTGGNDIEEYYVYYRLAGSGAPGEAITVTEPTRDLTIEELGNTEYELWVVSNNGHLSSDPSASVFATPYNIPAQPTNVTATGDTTGVTVSWDEPDPTGGQPITNYRLSYSGTSSDTIDVGTPLHYDLVLGAGSYTFSVIATNDDEHYGDAGVSESFDVTTP